MIAFDSMLSQAASEAGMLFPPDDIIDDRSFWWDDPEYIRFRLFCSLQIGVPMSAGAHWENAHVIMKIPENELETIQYQDILDLRWVI